MLCYTILCYAILYYTMLYYTTPQLPFSEVRAAQHGGQEADPREAGAEALQGVLIGLLLLL